jgi:hypothetical protein
MLKNLRNSSCCIGKKNPNVKICCIQTKESMPWCVTEIIIQIFVDIGNFRKLSWNWIWKWVHTMDSNDHEMRLWIKLQCILP